MGIGKNMSTRAYVSSGEVSTLKHEARDDAMEGRALIAEAFLGGAEGTKIGSSAWYHTVIQFEGNLGRRT